MLCAYAQAAGVATDAVGTVNGGISTLSALTRPLGTLSIRVSLVAFREAFKRKTVFTAINQSGKMCAHKFMLHHFKCAIVGAKQMQHVVVAHFLFALPVVGVNKL